MLPLFVGQDALNLLLGLPLLLGALWLARRGVLVGLLLWPGALFYVLYDYGYHALGAAFNVFSLAYIALMTLSAYTLVGIIASVDGAAVRVRWTDSVSPRLVGGFLVGLALWFTTLWTALTGAALLSGTPLDLVAHTVVILDLTVQLPALLAGRVLLRRRAPFAYVIAGGLLLQTGAYLIGLSALTVLQEAVTHAPLDPVAVLPGLIVGAMAKKGVGSGTRSLTAHPVRIRAGDNGEFDP